MAILGFFKKNKLKFSSSPASVAQDDIESAEDYILSPPSASVPSVGNGDDGYASSGASFVSAASSKKSRLPFSKKPCAGASSSPLARPYEPPPGVPDLSSSRLSLGLDTSLNSSPLHTSVLPSFYHSISSPTLSRPSKPDAPNPPQAASAQKTDLQETSKSGGGLFSWRERKKSKPSKPGPDDLLLPPLSDDSFNLKSFRHVLPEPRPDSPNLSPAQSSLVPPARPRGSSMASTDSSQRISVAAFREAQARRSSTNLVNGTPSPTIRPISVADSVGSDVSPLRLSRVISPPSSISPVPVPGPMAACDRKALPSRPTSQAFSSSDASSSESSESEDCSPSRSRSRLSRQRTITKRSYRANSDLGHGNLHPADYAHHKQSTSARSELGHGSPARNAQRSPSRGPPPSSFQKASDASVGTRSFSLYSRQRASLSTSELNPNAAAQRASILVEANKRDSMATALNARVSSNTSDSESESDSSDDDAPLSALRQPKRPGCFFSHSSSDVSAPIHKPLIDLSSKSNPLTGKPVVDTSGAERQRKRSTLISPTNINGRLSQLTAAAGLGDHRTTSALKSEVDLSKMTSPKPTYMQSLSKAASPLSNGLLSPPVRTTSPEMVAPSARKSSLPVSTQGSTEAQTDDLRPILVRDRQEASTGFRVVSRPQKSATSPPSLLSFTDSSSKPAQQQPTPATYHRQAPSSTSAISRPPSNMPMLDTKPFLVAYQNEGAKSTASPRRPSASPSQCVTSTPQQVPQRPFVIDGKRRDSPASSTGGSSNGRAPLTPMDGSDYFSPNVRSSGDSPSGSSVGTVPSAMKGGRGHMKRASVTFQEPVDFNKEETVRGRRSSLVRAKQEEHPTVEERENRRRERRRGEAKAAIELGNVINGRGPIDVDDDEDAPIRASMAPRLNPISTAGGMNVNFNTPMGWQQQSMPPALMGAMAGMSGMSGMGGVANMSMNVNPQQFMMTPALPNADPTYFAAHQQAMQIAKQAYQYAVAQQAMAAAADEWERGSTVSGLTPAGGFGMGMGGFGMGGMNGMNGMWGSAGQMYSAAPRSMYSGSTMGGAMSEAGWGTASVYGEAFGPSMPANARRSLVFSRNMRSSSGGNLTAVAFPSSNPRAEPSGKAQQTSAPVSRNGPRPRTRTAPSNAPRPTHNRVPPSSWKTGP